MSACSGEDPARETNENASVLFVSYKYIGDGSVETININLEKLSATMQALTKTCRELDGHIQKIESLTGSLSGMWAGEAHQAFQAAVQSDIAALKAAKELLKTVTDFEDQSWEAYSTCESFSCEQVGGISL